MLEWVMKSIAIGKIGGQFLERELILIAQLENSAIKEVF